MKRWLTLRPLRPRSLQGREVPSSAGPFDELGTKSGQDVSLHEHHPDRSAAPAESTDNNTDDAERPSDSFTDLKNEIYNELKTERLGGSDPGKFFFPNGIGKKVLHHHVPKIFDCLSKMGLTDPKLSASLFAERIEERDLYTFMASMVYVGFGKKPWGMFVKELVASNSWSTSSAALPLRSERACNLFGPQAADRFEQSQLQFCAIVLEEKRQLVSDLSYRLPYTSEEDIGGGSFGRVVKVKIAPHHFRFCSTTNGEELEVARKDYLLEDFNPQHHRHELEVLRTFIQNDTKCEYIMENLASLQIGQRYHLFMELAQCDLYQYMTDPRRSNPPSGIDEKAVIVRRAAGVSRALWFLHEELRSDEFGHVVCLHMDLKPQNILVVSGRDGEERWKLSDFNISRVKPTVKLSSDQHNSGKADRDWFDFNSLFKENHRPSPTASRADDTYSPRTRGTYLAPEAHDKPSKVSVESDIWSLGCVLSVVFSYMENGKRGVEEFEEWRKQGEGDDKNDYFHTRKSPRKALQLNPKVESWFGHLQKEARKRDLQEGELVENVLKYIARNVLIPDRKRRRSVSARDVHKMLLDAIPKKQTNESNYLLQGDLHQSSSQHSRKVQSTSSTAELSPAPKDVQFSPNGEYLVFVSQNSITARSTLGVNLLDKRTPCRSEDLILLGRETIEIGRIQSVSVSNHHIIVATDLDHFDCYIFALIKQSRDNGGLKLLRHLRKKELGHINSLAMSPNSQHAVFHIFNPAGQSNGKYSLHFAEIRLAQDADVLHWLRRVDVSVEALDPPQSSRVTEMRFTNLNTFYAVLRLDHPSRSCNFICIRRWHGWSSSSGELKELRGHILKGTDDHTSRDFFTAFAAHNLDTDFAVVTRENRLYRSSSQMRPGQSTTTNVISYRLYKITIDSRDNEVFALAKQQDRAFLELVRFPLNQDVTPFKPKSAVRLPSELKANGRFALVWRMSEGEEKSCVIFATSTGKIYHFAVG